MNEAEQRQRLDKWLWAARFFKTRNVATQQVNKGRVSVNGQRAKPSRAIAAGDVVVIQKHPYEFEVEVQGLREDRRPAVEASLLYSESERSIARRAEVSALQRIDHVVSRGMRGEGRPSKRQRRQIVRFRNRNEGAVGAGDATDRDESGDERGLNDKTEPQ